MKRFMSNKLIALFTVLSFSPAVAAKKAKKPVAAAPVVAQQNEAAARAALEQFLKPGADVKALTETLRPTPNDFFTVFDPTVAQKAQSYYATLWTKDATVTLKPGATELKLFHATTDELLTAAPSSQKFPLGWRTVAKSLKKGLVFYSWKFAAPGDDKAAQLYDGLVSVNGHWAWFPKIWNAIK
jgi:hypothetical protein